MLTSTSASKHRGNTAIILQSGAAWFFFDGRRAWKSTFKCLFWRWWGFDDVQLLTPATQTRSHCVVPQPRHHEVTLETPPRALEAIRCSLVWNLILSGRSRPGVVNRSRCKAEATPHFYSQNISQTAQKLGHVKISAILSMCATIIFIYKVELWGTSKEIQVMGIWSACTPPYNSFALLS